MGGKREKPEDIVLKLRQIEVLHGQGMPVADAVRQVGITQQSYYRWRRLYGGMSRSQLKRLKVLEKIVTERGYSLSDEIEALRKDESSGVPLDIGKREEV